MTSIRENDKAFESSEKREPECASRLYESSYGMSAGPGNQSDATHSNPDRTYSYYECDKNGKIIARVTPHRDGPTRDYPDGTKRKFDNQGRVVDQLDTDGTRTTLSYDELGNLVIRFSGGPE